ncbi:dehydrodolichyl diphosphate synthase CPT5, chloroplastic-like isoform X2 [Andrographis paniculata]|uniref:dehydrodolichyl diphosphate synthase CPT5, chloroplastic-like isoform X2 n=1 Tax=Andrographis paniculata TaxID=175694 RepID=UPI0021E96B8A|nr:dehydrodolichyl diphosphate synthase CPT5, chloroplastic-like isoform X2 [Andrographis paniculata]
MDRDEDNRLSELSGAIGAELMPKHVAVILDGHERWAKKRNLPTQKGHEAGIDNLKTIILTASSDFGIKAEVNHVMGIWEDFIRSYVMELIHRNNLRFSIIGDRPRLPDSIQSAILEAEESSKFNNGMHFVMALRYSGRLDITEAAKRIARNVGKGIVQPQDVSDELLHQHLMTSSIQVPDPDLLIRTSGERRLSNFLLWQLAHTKFYFVDKMFPDFDMTDFAEALTYFQGTKRY